MSPSNTLNRLLAVVIAAGAVMVALPAVAARATTLTASCTNTALANPLLGTPKCTTKYVTAPTNVPYTVRFSLHASSVFDVGVIGATMSIFDSRDPSLIAASFTCSGNGSCSKTVGPGDGGPGDPIGYAATCSWTKNPLIAIFATVRCESDLSYTLVTTG